MRDGDQIVVLLGYQCDKPGAGLQELSVGRETTKSVGPAAWAVKAEQQVTPQPEVRLGVAPDGYRVTVDDLHGGDLGSMFWVMAAFGGNTYTGVDFDVSRLKKDGQVLDNSGGTIARAEFDKRYACSS